MTDAATQAPARRDTLADQVYEQLKQDLFGYRLLPGDRFTEADVVARTGASRTPVRQALYRLQREGFVMVHLRNGWQVRPVDFAHFDALYEARIVLELAAIERLCARPSPTPAEALRDLSDFWLVPESERLDDGPCVSQQDEAFHCRLVEAAGNPELARMHVEVTERIRILRRLDFTQGARIQATYDEHAAVLRALLTRRADEARRLLKSHIEISRAEVQKITLHMLHTSRSEW
ncbi:Transcriptional regulator, GntR family [plant metagenome]|uniref:Transcriptional regulator, GntR family n=1 Tax=plant metagenome TaxID=1297885 RepID=A0A484RMF4_9ZZZZ